MSSLSIPDVKLNDGRSMPILGLGTYSAEKSGDREKTEQVVYDAIKLGYRHIDTAYIYRVEAEVGRGCKRAIDEGIVKREDLFITTKIWMTNMHRDALIAQAKESNEALGLGYIDLLLVHWPLCLKETGKGYLMSLFPVDENNKIVIDDDIDLNGETWPAMEETVSMGIAKSIGVSNYNCRQLKALLEVAKIKPANNQLECTPYLPQKQMLKLAKEHGVTITAYSPFGGGPKPSPNASDLKFTQTHQNLFSEPTIKSIAVKHNKTVNQILLKFQVQRGVIVIPKTVTYSRLTENGNVFDFTLSDDDMAALEALENGQRSVDLAICSASKNFPFNEP